MHSRQKGMWRKSRGGENTNAGVRDGEFPHYYNPLFYFPNTCRYMVKVGPVGPWHLNAGYLSQQLFSPRVCIQWNLELGMEPRLDSRHCDVRCRHLYAQQKCLVEYFCFCSF